MIKDFKSVAHRTPFRQLAVLGDKLSPNHITLLGFLAALMAAACALRESYALCALFVLIHLLCDGLDGYIARKKNLASELGFLLDHVLDRMSDVILFPLIGFSVGALIPGLLVALVCVFSSYIGVLNKVIGAPQDKGGPFAKSYRYQLLIFLLVSFHFLPELKGELFRYFCFGSLTIGLLTVLSRLRALFSLARGESGDL